MLAFLVGLTIGAVVGVIATILVFRKNKGVQAQAELAVDAVKQKIDKH
jgi:gas vesicle protein